MPKHPEEDLLSSYPVVTDIVVRWGDMDSLGHVNNILYGQYFETARIAHHERVGIPAPVPHASIDSVILAETSYRFRAPVTYPDTLSVGSRVSAIGRDSFTMEYAAVSQKLGKLVAEGTALVVLYNYLEGRRAPMSAELRAAIIEVEGHEPPPVPPRSKRGAMPE